MVLSGGLSGRNLGLIWLGFPSYLAADHEESVGQGCSLRTNYEISALHVCGKADCSSCRLLFL
jgi:hypothetical protein